MEGEGGGDFGVQLKEIKKDEKGGGWGEDERRKNYMK